jgi:hypothetical protein
VPPSSSQVQVPASSSLNFSRPVLIIIDIDKPIVTAGDAIIIDAVIDAAGGERCLQNFEF